MDEQRKPRECQKDTVEEGGGQGSSLSAMEREHGPEHEPHDIYIYIYMCVWIVQDKTADIHN